LELNSATGAPLATSGIAGVTETTTTTISPGPVRPISPVPGVGIGYAGYGVVPGGASYSQTTYSTGYPGAIAASTVGVGGLGVSTVPVTRTSTVSTGTTIVAPTIYEKAIVQDIPSSSPTNTA